MERDPVQACPIIISSGGAVYRCSLALLILLALAPPTPAKAATPFDWQTDTPESQGMSKARLDALRDELARRNTRAFLVVRNDRIVYEWYASDFGPAKLHAPAS